MSQPEFKKYNEISEEEQCYFLFNVLTQGVIYQDSKGKIILANPASENILGLSAEKIVGNTSIDQHGKAIHFNGSKFPSENHPGMVALRTGKKAGGLMGVFNSKLEKYRWIQINSFPLFKEGKSKPNLVCSVFEDITEKIEVEVRAKKIGVFLQSVIDGVGEPVMVIDLDFNIKLMNKKAYQYFGIDPKKKAGLKCHQVSHKNKNPCTGLAHPCPLSVVRKTGKQVTLVHEHIVSSGERRFVEIIASPLLNSEGKLEGIVETSRDITKRKKDQEALREEKEKFRKYIDTSAVIIVLLDSSGKVTLVNSKGCEVLGYKEEEIIGKNWFDNFLPEISKDEAKKTFLKLMTGEVKDVEYYENKILTKSGEERMVAWYNSIIRNGEGKIVSILSSGADITERKKDEEELKFKSELLDNATDSIFVHDFEGNMLYVNKAAYKTRGYTKEELLKVPLQKLDTPEMAKNIPRNIEKLEKYGSAVFETCHLGKSGAKLPVETTAKIIDYKGKKAIAGVARDISDRKKAEKKLLSAYESEHRIAQTLQSSLLPTEIPKIEGLEIRYYYHSAEKEAEVGGDFYDLFETVNGKYGLVMGDVEGKGLGAAAETAKVKYILRDRALSGLGPPEVISLVNSALYKQKGRPFTALTYCLYNPKSSVLAISNAGNPYPYNLRDDSFIKLSGIPVSIMASQHYEKKDIKMEAGDIIVMYTDGLIETRRGKELFGEERARKFIKENYTLPAEELLKGLVEKAREFSEGKIKDDMLILYVKKKI